MQEPEQCGATEGMLMTFETLTKLDKIFGRVRMRYQMLFIALVLVLDVMAVVWHARTFATATVALIALAAVNMLTSRLHRGAVRGLVMTIPVQVIGYTLGRLGRERACHVCFACASCGEQTTLEFTGKQYDQFVPGVILFWKAMDARACYVRPVERWKDSLEIGFGDDGLKLDLHATLELKDDVRLADLMMRYTAGGLFMYNAVSAQLRSEVERIAAEFKERPIGEFIEFVTGFGFELEGLPYRARIKRAKEVKVKPANGAGH